MKNLLRTILLLCVSVVLCACGQKAKLLNEARECWQQQNFQKAAALYERYLQEQKEGEARLDARLELANTYFINLHNYTRAEIHYRLMLLEARPSPSTLIAVRRLAELAIQKGRLDQAIGHYEQLYAQVEASERRELRLTIANLYYDRNDIDQAEIEYLKVVEGAPYDTFSETAYLRIASIRHRLRRQYQTAIPIYVVIKENTKDLAVVRSVCYGLAECYAAAEQYTVAISMLKQMQPALQGAEFEQWRRQIKDYRQRRKRMQEVPEVTEVDWRNPPAPSKP